MNPLVTILITNYNYQDYVVDAIESAREQTYTNTEIIVVDDGSTDKSLSVIGAYCKKHPNLIQVVSQDNQGTAGARNSGLSGSKGELIQLLDADDQLLPMCVGERVEAFQDEMIGVVYSDFYSLYPDGTREREYRPHFDALELLNECIVSTNAMYRRTIFEQFGGWNPKYKIIEDYELYVRVCRHTRFHHIAEPHFLYRQTDQNKTKQADDGTLHMEYAMLHHQKAAMI